MLRVFLKKHDFDPDMLIRVMLIKESVQSEMSRLFIDYLISSLGHKDLQSI